MPSHTPHKVVVVHKQSLSLLSLFTTLVSVALIVAGAIGLVLVQQPLQETQELRSDASVSTGPAILSTNPADNSNFNLNQEAKIDLRVDTDGIQTSEISLVFSILTETTDSLIVQTYSDTNLEITQQEIEQTQGGLLVYFKARPRTGTFSSTDPRRVASVIFTPTRTGEFKLSFDADESTLYQANTSPAVDLLKTVGSFSFNVVNQNSSIKSCNQSCSSNSECPVNHRCFENRCRLAINLGSTSCATPPDQGLNRQCNEYCSDTSECTSGLTCFYNRCRRSDNPDSESCALSTTAQQQAIADNCNDSCNSNADCAVNMRCFQGACRLASNVSSTTCSAPTKKTVSPIYGDDLAKGGTTPVVSPTPSTRPSTSTGSATATGSAVVSPRPTTPPSPAATPTPVPPPNAEPTNALDALLMNGITLPIMAIIAGFALLVLVIVITIINQVRRRGGSPGSLPNRPKPASSYEQDLQSKINALKNQPAPPPTNAASQPAAPASPPVTPPIAPVTPSSPPVAPPAPIVMPPNAPPPKPMAPTPTVATPTPPTVPPPSTLRVATPTPSNPAPAQPQPAAQTGSSMLERIKQKGIVFPQDSTGQTPPQPPSQT